MTVRPDESRSARLRRWLKPGSGIKRWLLVMFLGLTILATAGALLIRILFREVPADSPPGVAFELLSLNFLPDPLRPIAVVVIGGLGSMRGALAGALVVGVLRAIAIAVYPALEMLLIYLIVIAVLVLRPRGLFGKAATA